MKKTIFKTMFFLLMIITISACKRDKEPAARYKLEGGTYSVNCINCIANGFAYSTLNYSSSIKVSFYVTHGHISKVGEESYLKIHYLFDEDGPSSSFLVPYKSLTIVGSNISFDSNWMWFGYNNLSLTIELYTGRGIKSKPLKINVPKPAGSN